MSASSPPWREIAAAAGWSEYHFARVFRRWAGISPKHLAAATLADAAQQSLAGERSVLQAALDAGLRGRAACTTCS